MDIIWFERNAANIENLKARSEELEQYGFSGTMYPYTIHGGDFFTKIPYAANYDSKFKYIIAVRTYAISPQYLYMICKSLNQKYRNRIHLNFLTGWIYDSELEFGGVLTEPNDKSSNIDRSNYMLKYAEEFNRIKMMSSEFYISTTNKEIFDKCKEKSFPMIIPYSWYKLKKINLSETKYIISIRPVFDKKEFKTQDTEYFTKESFFKFLDKCKADGVNGILIQEEHTDSQYEIIKNIISEYGTINS